MTPERLNELKWQLEAFVGVLPTSKFDELIADLERLQAFSAAQDATDCRFQIAGVQIRIEALKTRLPFRWPSRKKEER